MPKRKLDGEVDPELSDSSKSQKIYNTIDSDEEEEIDESVKYALKDEDIEGQEDGGGGIEEGIQITPFNMKEEMEEGHFDSDGMYHWNKEKLPRDNWLDNIDWMKIKEAEASKGSPNSDSDNETFFGKAELSEIYQKILKYLQPKETITLALKRLGGTGRLSASERLKLKKSGQLEAALKQRNSNAVTELTELANSILTKTGNMNVYEESYEIIETKIRKEKKDQVKEAVLDMYADDFADKEKARLNEEVEKNDDLNSSSNAEVVESPEENEVMWEMKETSTAEKIEGPFTSRQMESWSRSGKFKPGSLVRKVGTSDFYSLSRIDFDLYI